MEEYTYEERQAYQMYVIRKESAQKKWKYSGKINTGSQDRGRGKVYEVENELILDPESEISKKNAHLGNIEEFQKYVNRVTKSKLWEQIAKNPSRKVKCIQHRGHGGYALYGRIHIGKTSMTKYFALHELAHVAGMMHHDLGFRINLLKLVSRFMGTAAAKELKKGFKSRGLKTTKPQFRIQPIETWISGYYRMEKARKGKV